MLSANRLFKALISLYNETRTGMLEEKERLDSSPVYHVIEELDKKIDPVPTSSSNTLAPQSRKDFIKI